MPILIIADKGFHKLYRSFANGHYQLFECTYDDSKDAVEKCGADLIFLDCGSDTDKCLETLKNIKSWYPSTPVIFLADPGKEDVVLKAFRLGARDFFKKPVNLDELRETADGILAIKKSSVERRRPLRLTGSRQKDPLKMLTTSHPVNLINVMRHIEKNLTTPPSLNELAEIAEISKYHFCRFFKKHIGMSPVKYILSRRIAKAREFLRKEDIPISAIASSVGFNDMSSFTVQFKRLTGKTPIKYKLAWKNTRKKIRKRLKERIKAKTKTKSGKKNIFKKAK